MLLQPITIFVSHCPGRLKICRVEVYGELALIVAIADDDEFSVILQNLNVIPGKVIGPEVFRYELLLWLLNGGEVDK